MLPKLAYDSGRYRRRVAGFVNARTAFKAFLSALPVRRDQVVLLPGYVGWSAREGSGVLDPVLSLGLRHRFYRVGPDLTIDLDDLGRALQSNPVAVVVIIHFFGRCDPGYAAAVLRAREAGASVVDDEAHAMLTDLVGGVSGRLGDAAIFSLHKLLPVPAGGVLVANTDGPWVDPAFSEADHGLDALHEFDLVSIARNRRANAQAWLAAVESLAPLARPFWPGFPGAGEVPQTLPVLVSGAWRDELYERANAAGIGVVSLYHTLVDSISPAGHSEAHQVSRHILNLPVHQDIDPQAIPVAAERLGAIMQTLEDGQVEAPVR